MSEDNDLIARMERIAAGDTTELPINNWAPVISQLLRDAAARIRDCQWQPIETAPKDGTFIWLSDGSLMRVGFWTANRWADMLRAETGGPRDLAFAPTHWMPTPKRP